ncbi:hypothetical protein M9H77_36411 [Catharanthus roseus]|uniref:Uncharacterized protein n=1 Tax=Catharanthus roseus TaxID=4058 RepID=A0ACB9ZRQ0_CATRO|nr:hypothetical protein M9H77_36411 [Catharanthus roseus]
MNEDGQLDEKIQGPIVRPGAKKIKENDDHVAHGLMIAIEGTMNKGLKFKNGGLKDDRNHPKLLMKEKKGLEVELQVELRSRTAPSSSLELLKRSPNPLFPSLIPLGLASRSLAEEFVAWIPVEGEAYKAAPP